DRELEASAVDEDRLPGDRVLKLRALVREVVGQDPGGPGGQGEAQGPGDQQLVDRVRLEVGGTAVFLEGRLLVVQAAHGEADARRLPPTQRSTQVDRTPEVLRVGALLLLVVEVVV